MMHNLFRWIVIAGCFSGMLVAWPALAHAGGKHGGAARSEDAASAEKLRKRLRKLEAKYKKTGEPKYMFERVLALEEMGEYQFALEVLKEHRGEFESSSEVDGVAVVEQRLREAADEAEGGGSSGPPKGTSRSSSPAEKTDPLTWALIGGGGAFAVGSIVPFVVAETRAKRLRCSPVSEGPSADGCDGVDPYRGLTKSEFDRKSTSVTTFRVLGVGLAIVGSGAVGYGLYRLLGVGGSGSRARAAAGLSAPRVTWGVSARGARVGLRFDF